MIIIVGVNSKKHWTTAHSYLRHRHNFAIRKIPVRPAVCWPHRRCLPPDRSCFSNCSRT